MTVGVVSATARNILPTRRSDRPLPRHDPDRRRHQPRQLGRAADQRAGRGRRGQLLDLQQQRRLGRPRVRHPDRARAAAWPTRSSGAARCGGPGSGSRSRAPPPCGTGRARAAWWSPAVTPDGPAARAGLKPGRRAGRGERPPAPQLSRLGGGQARPPRRRRGGRSSVRSGGGSDAPADRDRRPADRHRREGHRAAGPAAHQRDARRSRPSAASGASTARSSSGSRRR